MLCSNSQRKSDVSGLVLSTGFLFSSIYSLVSFSPGCTSIYSKFSHIQHHTADTQLFAGRVLGEGPHRVRAEYDEQQALKVATDYLGARLGNPMATGTQFTCLTDQSVDAYVLHQGAQRYTLLISTLPLHQRHLEAELFAISRGEAEKKTVQ